MRKADLVDQISAKLRAQIPGANFSFTQPIIDNVTEAVTGSPADLAVIISGPDLKRLRALADQTLAVLRQVPGAADTFLEQEAEQAQLRILIDRAERGALRHQRARRGGRDRDGDRRQADQHGVRRREALRHHGALPGAGARRCRRHRQHPGADARWRPRAALATGAHRSGQRREHHRAPREHPPDFGAHQYSRPRPGQLRHRGAGQVRTRGQTASRLLGGLGRAVRESGARAQAADHHSADHHRHHLRAAVLRLRRSRCMPAWCW